MPFVCYKQVLQCSGYSHRLSYRPCWGVPNRHLTSTTVDKSRGKRGLDLSKLTPGSDRRSDRSTTTCGRGDNGYTGRSRWRRAIAVDDIACAEGRLRRNCNRPLYCFEDLHLAVLCRSAMPSVHKIEILCPAIAGFGLPIKIGRRIPISDLTILARAIICHCRINHWWCFGKGACVACG